jgi:hypothetical protein
VSFIGLFEDKTETRILTIPAQYVPPTVYPWADIISPEIRVEPEQGVLYRFENSKNPETIFSPFISKEQQTQLFLDATIWREDGFRKFIFMEKISNSPLKAFQIGTSNNKSRDFKNNHDANVKKRGETNAIDHITNRK